MKLENFKSIYYCKSKIDNTYITIKNHKIPESFNGLKIAHISDFHSNEAVLNNLIMSINVNNPHIIVLTGDMVNKYDYKFKAFYKLIETLSGKYPLYYVFGNHEKKLSINNQKRIFKVLNKNSVNDCNNKKYSIYKNKEKINIYGIDLNLVCYKLKNKNKLDTVKKYFDKYLANINKEEFNILLIHNPLFFEEYSKYNIDLILSGHVHGGMINVPFLGGILSPERKFFPRFCRGIYEKNNSSMIVSRGLGHSRPGIRINNNPEVIFITLKKDC